MLVCFFHKKKIKKQSSRPNRSSQFQTPSVFIQNSGILLFHLRLLLFAQAKIITTAYREAFVLHTVTFWIVSGSVSERDCGSTSLPRGSSDDYGSSLTSRSSECWPQQLPWHSRKQRTKEEVITDNWYNHLAYIITIAAYRQRYGESEWMIGWTVGRMDERTDGPTDDGATPPPSARLSEWVSERWRRLKHQQTVVVVPIACRPTCVSGGAVGFVALVSPARERGVQLYQQQ